MSRDCPTYPDSEDPDVTRVMQLYGFDELQARRHVMQRRELASSFAQQSNAAPWGRLYLAEEASEASKGNQA